MNRSLLLVSFVFGSVLLCSAESVSVVQITDMQGQVAYEVKTREELATLQKEIKEETAVYPAVAAECEKEWKANKENKLPFQGNRIKVRSVKKIGDFLEKDKEKAEKKRSQLEDRESTRQAEELAKEEKKNKNAKVREEDAAKEDARKKAFADAYEMISKKMADKLGRPVPGFGFNTFESKKEEPKEEEPKKDEKKKDEKKAGH